MRPSEHLRTATSEPHARLDQSAYAQALHEGSLSVVAYASFLRALHRVHGSLENELALGRLEGFASRLPGRRAALERDLTDLGEPLRLHDAASREAELIAGEHARARVRAPAELLGHSYVLEGSTLGGLVQRTALLGRTEFVGGRGLSYLAGQGSKTRAHFLAFLSELDVALADAAACAQAVRGAHAAFQGFECILRALVQPADVALASQRHAADPALAPAETTDVDD
jgi:heme oxygenase